MHLVKKMWLIFFKRREKPYMKYVKKLGGNYFKEKKGGGGVATTLVSRFCQLGPKL